MSSSSTSSSVHHRRYVIGGTYIFLAVIVSVTDNLTGICAVTFVAADAVIRNAIAKIVRQQLHPLCLRCSWFNIAVQTVRNCCMIVSAWIDFLASVWILRTIEKVRSQSALLCGRLSIGTMTFPKVANLTSPVAVFSFRTSPQMASRRRGWPSVSMAMTSSSMSCRSSNSSLRDSWSTSGANFSARRTTENISFTNGEKYWNRLIMKTGEWNQKQIDNENRWMKADWYWWQMNGINTHLVDSFTVQQGPIFPLVFIERNLLGAYVMSARFDRSITTKSLSTSPSKGNLANILRITVV